MKEIKILRDHHDEIYYSEEHWNLLKSKRYDAKKLLAIFSNSGFKPFLYGSIARGDIHKDSDIDIFFTENISAYRLELVLENNGYSNYFREIIMATPKDSLKLYIYLSELESITLPLSKFEKKHAEFYDFGGKVDINQLNRNIRVSGIDKRLVFIKPTEYGHEEYSVIGNEHIIAKELNISIDLINERKRVLLKRENLGRTGVFFKRELDIHESIEEVLKQLTNRKTIIRKKLSQR
ncbi:MAG: nucleotidyltransferase domain-containing protein [Candidatus Thorarchaeota archaeon]